MKSNKSPKTRRGMPTRLASKSAALRSDRLAKDSYQVDEIFDLQGSLGWDEMVDRIRRGDGIRGRSL